MILRTSNIGDVDRVTLEWLGVEFHQQCRMENPDEPVVRILVSPQVIIPRE